MTAHTDTATAPPSTSNRMDDQDAYSLFLSRSVPMSASKRAQLIIADTERKVTLISNSAILLIHTSDLNILISYQTHESTGHWETPDPLEEVEILRRKIELAREKFKTQTTLEMARAELAKRKLAQESMTPVVKRNHIRREMDEGMEKWSRKVAQMKSG